MPIVWVLQGHRTGDNLQVQALADGLGWPHEGKILTWQTSPLNRLPQWTPFYGRSASLKHLTPDARKTLAPPWPDIVLSIGWRSVPIARWIQQQCGSRLVHLGRPRAPLKNFDLVLTTPQYRLPDTKNVVHLSGPLTTLSPEMLTKAARAWAQRLAHLPRPWIAVLVGGDAPTLRFPPAAAQALGSACNEHAARTRGSLLIATSPRTSDTVANVLRGAVNNPSFFHQWRKETDNPYAAFLALADEFIVTNDSISMTHEAALTGHPVHIFPLTAKESLPDRALSGLDRKLRRGGTVLTNAYLDLIRSGMIYPPKSPSDYFRELMQNGRASMLNGPGTVGETQRLQSDNARAVQAVQALLAPDNTEPQSNC